MPSTVPSLMFTPPPHTPSPHSYIKMDNFYTVTVYEKGAEVVRLYNTLLGKEGFRKGEREEVGWAEQRGVRGGGRRGEGVGKVVTSAQVHLHEPA